MGDWLTDFEEEPAGDAAPAPGGGSWRDDFEALDILEVDAADPEPPGRALRSTVLDEMPIRGDVQGFAEPERPYGSGLTPRGRALAQYQLGEGDHPGPSRVGIDYEARGVVPAMGILDGVTFGYADEIGGALRAPFTDRSYREEQQQLESELDRGREQAPWQFAGGNVIGGLATAPVTPLAGAGAATRMGRVGGAVATGVGYGAAQGAGHSRGEFGSGQFVEDTLTGGAVGGVTGGLVQGAGEAAGAGIRSLAARAPRLQQRADEMRVLTAMGATGGTIARPRILKEAQRVPGGVSEIARVMREQGMAPRMGTTQGILDSASDVAERSHSAITDVLDSVEDVGTRIDINAFADDLEHQAQLLRAESPELDGVAAAIDRRASIYRSRYPDGVSMREAQRLVERLGERVNWTNEANGQLLPNAQQGLAAATRAMRRQMDQAAETAFSGQAVPQGLGPYRDIIGDPAAGRGAVDAYRQARRVNQVSRIVEDAATESTQRAGKNRLLGMSENQAAAIGSAVLPGSPMTGAALGAGLRRSVAQRGAAMRATGAEAIAAIARSAPQRLGPYASSITNALQRGPQAYGAAYFVMSQSDPQFRALVSEIESEEIE